MDYNEFIKEIKKVNKKRNYQITNSWGVYDGYKYYRKTKPKEAEYILKEVQYFAIIRKVNNILFDLLANGEDITFPCRMGKLELRKHKPKIKLDGNKVKINTPIDWNRTLKFWYEDKESFKNKIILKMEEKEIFKVHYNKNVANYPNKLFYQFKVNRDLKLKIKENIKENIIDAFSYETI